MCWLPESWLAWAWSVLAHMEGRAANACLPLQTKRAQCRPNAEYGSSLVNIMQSCKADAISYRETAAHNLLSLSLTYIPSVAHNTLLYISGFARRSSRREHVHAREMGGVAACCTQYCVVLHHS